MMFIYLEVVLLDLGKVSSNMFVDKVYPFGSRGLHNGVHMVVDTTWLEVGVAKISDQLE